MIANTAFGAALTVFLIAAWLAGELSFLAPFKVALFRFYGATLAAGTLLVFLHVFVAYYAVARHLFLRGTGRKLMHVDRELMASDGVSGDVPVEQWSLRQ